MGNCRMFMTFCFLAVLISVLSTGCGPKNWDYVALGDSNTTGFKLEYSYVDYYADYIEQDLGVNVEVHNFGADGLTLGELLYRLKNNEEIRIAIRDAEVITVWIGWNDMGIPIEYFRRDLCGGEDNLDCIREEAADMNADFDAVFDEILTLTNTQDTLIRIADNKMPFVNSWKYKGWFDILLEPAYDAWREHLVEAAESRGITVVYTYHMLNGPSGDLPLDESVTTEDRVHFNEEGHRLIAEMHREVGYDFAH